METEILGFPSEITSLETPKDLTKLSKKSLATKVALRAPSLIKKSINLQYLVNVSTWVKIA